MKRLNLERVALMAEIDVVETVTRTYEGKSEEKVVIQALEADFDDTGKPIAVSATAEIKSDIDLPKGKHRVLIGVYAYQSGNKAMYGLKVKKLLK